MTIHKELLPAKTGASFLYDSQNKRMFLGMLDKFASGKWLLTMVERSFGLPSNPDAEHPGVTSLWFESEQAALDYAETLLRLNQSNQQPVRS